MEKFKNTLKKISRNKPISSIAKLLFTLLLILVGVASFESTDPMSINTQICAPEEQPHIIYVADVDTFSEEKLIEYLIELNIKQPHIVLAQAKVESGYFTSDIFRENNNLFGMKEARVRAHTAIGTRRNHAYYTNWRQSVLDYALYQAAYLSDCSNEKEYFATLGASYAEASDYISMLKYVINNENLSEVFV